MTSRQYYTSEEILRKSDELGLELSDRKIKYYVTLGILPKPVRNPLEAKGNIDGRVAYFPPETLERLSKIKELQDSGFTLPQIKKYFKDSLDPALKSFLEQEQEGDDAVPLERIVTTLMGENVREATKSFIQAMSADDSAEAFQNASIQYYHNILIPLIGRERAEKYVRDFFINAAAEEREKKLEPLKRWRAQFLKSSAPQKPSFVSSYLDDLCNNLERGAVKDNDALEKLHELADKVNSMQSKYREQARVFNEAFDISKIMRQIFWIYLKALLEMESFVKNGKKEHLKHAKSLYGKADEMLGLVEDLIGRIRTLLILWNDIDKA
ncbi:MAG: MerR family transcriptional regulator [Candidatus Xenobiia bacterium LiM19]